MRSIKLYLGVAAVFLAFAAAVFGQVDTRATATWQVNKYDITAALPQSDTDRSLTATANLDLKNVSANLASTLTLRISQFATVTAATVNGSTVDFTKGDEKVNASTNLQRIAMRIPGVAPGATVNVTVSYKLNVKDNSGIASVTASGTQFLPLSFWYPTPTSWFFSRGADHGPFRVKLTGGNSPTIVSSGVESSGAIDNRFSGQPFFVAGNWDILNVGGIAVYSQKGIGPDGQKRAAEMAAIFTEAKAFVAGILGNAPDEPLRIVAVRRGGGFSGGGTVLVDEAVFRRPAVDAGTAMSIAEAAAKLWLGNSITVTGDGQGIIREGLCRFIATQFLESKYGKDVADIERVRQRMAYASISKRDVPMSQVSPLDDFYYPEVANKGAMTWRILDKRIGSTAFAAILRSSVADGTVSVAELREAFSAGKDLLDYFFDQPTTMNLMVGLPQTGQTETTVALRNTGSVDATVNVRASMANGQSMEASATVRAQSFGSVSFKTVNKITRVEVDTDKLYPQSDYSDDVAPRETTEGDLLLAVKRSFDKQDFPGAENTARVVLTLLPRFDDVRILLGRSYLAEGRNADAEKEFRAVLGEKLPTARSLGWATVGLAEIASRSNQTAEALKLADAAILSDSEYGVGLAARNIRNKLNAPLGDDAGVKAYFAAFDRAAVSNRKADVDALVVPGEVARFAGGISGSTEQWQTDVRHIDRLDANTVMVEANVSLKMLTRQPETGLAVFRLARSGSGWKLLSVDILDTKP